MPRRYTDEQKQAAREAYEQHGPHEAARQTGIPVGTVSAWASKLGWETSILQTTLAANAQHEANYLARRTAVRKRMLDVLEGVLDRFEQEHFEWKVVDKALERAEYDRPPSGAVKDYAVAAAVLVDKIRLEEGLATGRQETTANLTVDDRRVSADEVTDRARRLRAV